MVTQNPLTQARKLKLRWFITMSTLPLLAVVSAFGFIPQSEIHFNLNQKIVEEIPLPAVTHEADNSNTFWHTDKVQRGDTIAELLRRLNIDDTAASNYLRTNKAASSLQHLPAGKIIQAQTHADGSLISLHYTNSQGKQIVIEKNNDQLVTHTLIPQVEKRTFMRSGQIINTLFSATDAAGLPDATANQLADIFSGDIDFHRDLRKGDKFSVIYEMNYSNGEPVSSGKIIAAEFINQNHAYRAFYYETSPDHGDYFSADGKSMRKAFLRSPLEFSRVSSGFTLSRFHPILKKWRAHKGVDYAAAIGTKVKVTADGTIDFVGQQNGYGNVVIVKHQGRYTTVYGHLSRFASGLHRGQKVNQGDIIAYTGQSGMATGPHLHYEFKINGEQHDPLRVALPDAKPITAQQKMQFQTATASIVASLNMLSNNNVASLE
jgi:murein DD-endopeptidase MepM/ murein hydrolase activator NlpD